MRCARRHRRPRTLAQKHPELRISLAQFKLELPWNIKKAYRQTCLCRTCLQFTWYFEALAVVGQMIQPLINHPSADAEGADAEAAAAVDAPDLLLRELFELSQLKSRRLIGDALVCAHCLDDSVADSCLKGTCTSCGFARMWTRGLRAKWLTADAQGELALAPSAPEFVRAEMAWDTLKPAGGNSHAGSNDSDELRHRMTGTVMQFLDALAQVLPAWLPHRFHIVQAKKAARELDDGATPGIILTDSDWSENGEIAKKFQMQSEYWHTVHYSLLVKLARFLKTHAWIGRSGALPDKAEVTVQPDGAPADGVDYVAGSYFAIVKGGFSSAGEDVLYTVVKRDGSEETVPRRRLRHREWHALAILGFTNDKRHVGITSQAFHERELEFWREWQVHGRDAAHEYARADQLVRARQQRRTRFLFVHLFSFLFQFFKTANARSRPHPPSARLPPRATTPRALRRSPRRHRAQLPASQRTISSKCP